MSSTGIGPLCFANSKRFLSISCFHLLTSCMEILISFSTRTCHMPTMPKPTSNWFGDPVITQFDWPANLPESKPIENYCQEESKILDPTIQTS